MARLFFTTINLELGTDKSGRACTAGLIITTAILLPTCFENVILSYSTQSSPKTKENSGPSIEHQAIIFHFRDFEPPEADPCKILHAGIKAIQKYVLKPNLQSEYRTYGWKYSSIRKRVRKIVV